MKPIQLGDRGRDVEVWQRFLEQVWKLRREESLPGVFDDATHEATCAYQEECGLHPTGIVDRNTQERARQLGLALIEDAVPGMPGFSKILAGFSAFILLILLSQCMLMPESGRSVQGVPLPINPTPTPGSPLHR